MKDKDNKLILSALNESRISRANNPGFGSDGNEPPEDSEWSSEGLEELEPHELVQFIGEALPKFLQTHYDPEAYDDIRRALYNAAYAINWELGPKG